MKEQFDFSRFIEGRIDIALNRKLDELSECILAELTKPDYHSWGRYLTPKQAANYVGLKSVNGMKSMLSTFDIQPTKTSTKIVRYDREDLDRIKVQRIIDNYKMIIQ